MKKYLIIAAILLAGLVLVGGVGATIYSDNVNFTYNIPSSDGTLTNYQVKFILSNASGISGYYAPYNIIFTNGTTRPDWYDVNITDESGVSLPFWIENNTQTTYNATVWVKVPSISTSNTSSGTWKYGNASQSTSTMNGYSTFQYFSDYLGNSINTTQEANGGGTQTVSNGYMTVNGDDSFLTSLSAFGYNKSMRYRIKESADSGSINWNNGFGVSGGNDGNLVRLTQPAGRAYATIKSSTVSSAARSIDMTSAYGVSEIFRYPSSVVFAYNNVPQATITTNLPTINLNASFWQSATGGSSASVDWAFVRSATLTEPAISLNILPSPVSAFTTNISTGIYPPGVGVQFNDTSNPAGASWQWGYRNETPGNNTWINGPTTQNPSQFFGIGIWDVNLTSTNIYGSNTVTHTAAILVTSPANVIVDTDMAADVDDVGALAILNYYQSLGQVNISAVVINSANNYSAPCAKAINTFYGHSTIPVGSYQGNLPGGSYSSSVYTQQITNTFGTVGDSRINYPNATAVYRQILASDQNNSITIISIGYMGNLATLLQSPADGYSSLTGQALVSQKVTKLIVMGGYYPSSSSPENNFAGDPYNASYVFSNWPTSVPVIGNGYEMGSGIYSNPSTSLSTSTNPVRDAYYLQVGNGTTRSWDLLSALYGTYNLSSNFYMAGFNGTNTVNSGTGNNIWTQTPTSNDYYTENLASNAVLGAILNNSMSTVNTLPVPAFSGTPLSGHAPLSVAFTDASTGSPNSWNWSFGDGTVSSLQNPSHTYSTKGVYSVNLSVGNAYGNSSLLKSNYITANNASELYPSFTTNTTTGATPLTVLFTDTSSNYNATIDTWLWQFGDGNTSASKNATHNYSTAGSFNANLTVTNTTAGISNMTGNVAITPFAPTGYVQQDIWMEGEYTFTLHFTDATTGSVIPIVQVIDSNGLVTNTTTGTYVGTYPYSTIAITAISSGYATKQVSYIIDSNIDTTMQLTPVTTTTNSNTVWYVPKTVEFHVIDSSGNYLTGANVTAHFNSSTTLPGGLSDLINFYGMNQQAANNAANGTLIMTGDADSMGNVVFTMLSTLMYDVWVTKDGVTNYFSIHPQSTNYQLRFVGVIAPDTSLQTCVYANGHTYTSAASDYLGNFTMGFSYQDTCSKTLSLDYYVVLQNTNTQVYHYTQTPVTSGVYVLNYTVTNVRGNSYKWFENYTRSV